MHKKALYKIMNKYANMMLFTVGVELALESKRVAGELHLNTPLLPILPATCNKLAEWSQTTNLPVVIVQKCCD